MNTNFSTLGVGVDFNDKRQPYWRKLYGLSVLMRLIKGISLVDKEVDIMTTKDVSKLDILDKVKEILNKMKNKRTSKVYIVDFASSSVYRNI